MTVIIPPVKGTRDFYPELKALQSWLYQAIKKVSEQFGYQEYDGPFLEKIDLYAAKSGEELVKEQSYVFEDRGGDLIALRPELTPSLARMVSQRQNELAFPLRWWSFGPFWRYERPQRGRTREFFQWNIDLIGADSPEADAEMAAVGASFFRQVGLTPDEVNIQVNNRRLMNQALEGADIPADLRPAAFRLIDRRDKMSPEAWQAFAFEMGLSSAQFGGLVKILEDTNLWEKSEELRRFFSAIDALGVADYVRFNPQIIRGIAYYTGTVFEARDKDEEFRTILGGGRYDNLVGDVGGNPLSGVGFAAGDVVLPLVIKKYGHLPELPLTPADVLVTLFDQNMLTASFSLSALLRQAGVKVSLYPDAAKLPKQMKYADRMGIGIVTIIGPDENANGQVTIKNLIAHSQVTVAAGEAVEAIKKMLAAGVSS